MVMTANFKNPFGVLVFEQQKNKTNEKIFFSKLTGQKSKPIKGQKKKNSLKTERLHSWFC